MAGVFIIDDYTVADLNKMAIDSLRREIKLERFTAKRDALRNIQATLEELNLYLVVADSNNRARPLRRK